MSIPQSVAAGQPVSASNINAVVAAAKRIDIAPGAPTATIMFDPPDKTAVQVFVIARSVSVESPLDAHSYTVTDGTNEYAIDWTQIIVDVQPDLIGPDASVRQLFVPAEIAGQGGSAHWRAWGLLYRGPSPDGDGESVAAVKLFGVSPHRGC